MRATLSVYGMYKAYQGLFSGMLSVTSDNVTIDKQQIIDNIILECSELELLYSDPRYMQQAILTWSARELPIWQKLLHTTLLEYNPIWNKDGTVQETRKLTELTTNNTQTHNRATAEGSENGTQAQQSTSTGFNNGTSENSTSAYNESTYTNRDKTTENETSSDKMNGVSVDNRTNSAVNTADANGTSAEQHSNTEEYERREFGNIGVTSTQQLIKEERDVVQFNVISYIVDSFKKRFCLLIY